MSNKQWFLLLKWILWASLTISALGYFLGKEPYPTGDGIEYMLTTEAWKNHASPDIRLSDCESFKSDFIQHQSWGSNYKRAAFDEVEAFLREKGPKRKDYGGFYRNSHQNVYGYHFVFYSFVNVPARMLTEGIGIHPIKAFVFTNVFIWSLFFAWLLSWKNEESTSALVLGLLVFLSASFYYTTWTHPETLTVVLVLSSMLCLIRQRFHLALLFCGLATLQNQPLSFLFLWMYLLVWNHYGFQWSPMMKYLGYGVFVFVPPLYFYGLFGTTSLINDAGFLSLENLTSIRVIGFFFDLNQGMILSIGLFLFVYFLLFCWRAVQIIKSRNVSPWDSLPLVILAMTLLVSCMNNWNHGMAVVNRYAVWMSVPLMCHGYVLLKELRRSWSVSLASLGALSQLGLLYIHLPYHQFDWSNLQHMPFAKWTLSNYPAHYNPDPQIFIARTHQVFDFSKNSSPILYFNEQNLLRKIAVHERNFDTLTFFGYTPRPRSEYCCVRSGKEHWYYINDFEERSSKSSLEVLRMIQRSEMDRILLEMKANPEWMNSLEQKARSAGISLETQMEKDAEFIFLERHPAL
ncbi:MAG: hypothetical protein EBU82_09370 [Flavobacteriia bacterium]|nr:hypothetical protein [Flavobacteriia bacterium]